MEHILVCLLPGCLLAWMKNKPMSCHPSSSSSASSCRWAGVSVEQGSRAGELPPQPSANTNPWGPAWLWGNITAAASFPPPHLKDQHPFAAAPSSPESLLPSGLTARGFTVLHMPKGGAESGQEPPKSRHELFKGLGGSPSEAGARLELTAAVTPALNDNLRKSQGGGSKVSDLLLPSSS